MMDVMDMMDMMEVMDVMDVMDCVDGESYGKKEARGFGGAEESRRRGGAPC